MSASSDVIRAANTSVVLFDRSSNARIAIEGPDRAKFLHNLTTNEVKRLPEGRACEAFVTSPQGKTLAFVTLIVEPNRILLRTDAAAMSGLSPHFQKYGLFDDVQISDITLSTFELHLAGPKAADCAQTLEITNIPQADLLHELAETHDGPIRILNESPTGRPGLTLIGPLEAKAAIEARLSAALSDHGGCTGDDATYDVLRIEAGTPIFGREFTADNLPQELARDARAISFVKGCYLGQETVARLDALGHVNKILKGWRIEGQVNPPAGTALEADGKTVGTITSAGFSPAWNATVGLAMIRTSHARAGEVLRAAVNGESFAATVTDLPMVRASD
jgi:folate-binding protein YgfZ